MEKFSQWRDEGTGIAPFLPVVRPGFEEITVGSVLSAIVGALLAGITIPFALIAILLYAILGPITGRAGRQFLARLVLVLLKVFNVKLINESAKRGWVTRKLKKKTDQGRANKPCGKGARTRRGPRFELGLSVGRIGLYVFFFVLPLTRVDPVFVVPVGSTLQLKGSFSVMWAPLSGALLSANGDGHSWEYIISHAKNIRRPIVLFAEGTTTNGKGVLAPDRKALYGQGKKAAVMYPTVVKYDRPTITTPLPVYPLKWLLTISMLLTGINAKVGLATKVDPSLGGMEQQLAEGMYRMGRLRRLGSYFDIQSKRKFIAAWEKGR